MGLKDGEYQREPRWPIEMQVLPDKIRHIDNSFPQAEPFYSRSMASCYKKRRYLFIFLSLLSWF
jgi:hypothetical protein